MIWLGFELSVLGFLPIFRGIRLVIEGIIKYFLVQAGGSSLFLLSFIINDINTESVFLLSILLKLGLFPFYQWVPLVIRTIRWIGCLIVSTLQKVAPLFTLLNSQTKLNPQIALAGSLRVLIRGILGFNQTKFRALIAYSSIAHSGWILCSWTATLKISLLYFLTYTLITATTFSLFYFINTSSIISRIPASPNFIIINLLIITLTGIPPFSIFFIKIIIIKSIVFYPIPALILIIGTILSAYYYLSFIVPSILARWDLNYYAKKSYFYYSIIFSTITIPLILVW